MIEMQVEGEISMMKLTIVHSAPAQPLAAWGKKKLFEDFISATKRMADRKREGGAHCAQKRLRAGILQNLSTSMMK